MNLDEFFQSIEDYLFVSDKEIYKREGLIDQLYANYYGYVEDFK